MSVHHDNYVMVCVRVPEALWRKPNPCSPKYNTYVPGFSEKYETMIEMVHGYAPHHPVKPGTCGILYDGMSLGYCYFGVVVSVESWRERADGHELAAMAPAKLALLAADVEKLFDQTFDRPCQDVAKLRVIRHYH